MTQNVFEFCTTEEAGYKAVPVTVADGWDWSMSEHVKTTIFYKNGRLLTGNSDDKPVKNITRPILNLQYRSEGFDLKDIQLFVNDAKNYFKSFLVKKYHEKWARQNKIDTFIDKLVEAYVDFGGVLVKNVNQVRPEVVPFQSIAFCDQTDILSGPIGLKHFYSPDQLMEMSSYGWGDEKKGATATIDQVITWSKEKKKDKNGKESKTPGKYIEVYEIHGMFPKWWLENSYEASQEDSYKNEYVRQLHIICYYTKEGGVKQGVCLYKGKESESVFKFLARDEIYGRALGMGGAEELFEPQVWVNYDVIRKKEMLDAASKVIFQTADPNFSTRNNLKNLDNMEILVTEKGETVNQVNTTPVNIAFFDKATEEWEAHAQQMGAANDSIMGKNPSSGTPFALQELVTAESHSLHEYRKGKLATFLNEIYTDWVIPYIAKEIARGQEFIADLDLDELQYVADSLVVSEANKVIKEMILNGEPIGEQEIEAYKQQVRDAFMKGGNKKFLNILEGEMKDAPMDVFVNIAGKQKDLANITDKLVGIFRQIVSSVNPQTGQSILDDPRMAKLLNQIIEYSGLNPVDFYSKPKPSQELQQPVQVAAGRLSGQMEEMMRENQPVEVA